jgi:hypothetical protein
MISVTDNATHTTFPIEKGFTFRLAQVFQNLLIEKTAKPNNIGQHLQAITM